MASKFRGNYVEATVTGLNQFKFKKSGNDYTMSSGVKTYINNILVGKFWINFQGEVSIVNHRTNEVCLLKYFPYSYFSKDPPNKIMGVIKDSKNIAKYVLEGICTENLECFEVLNQQKVNTFDEIKKLKKEYPRLLWKHISQP